MAHNKLWKILKEIGVPDPFTCLMRNLYVGQETIVRNFHGTIDWFQIEKGMQPGCILSLCLFNFYVENITQYARLEEHKLESRLLGKLSATSDM